MKVNKRLLWDYGWTESDFRTEEFRRWYVARVLAQGTSQDVRDLGFDVIRQELPHLWLPAAVEQFWEWYFGLPHARPTRKDPYTFPPRAA